MSTWFITGCSTGLGQALARAVLEAGHQVIITARNTNTLKELVDSYPDRALPVALDITDSTQVESAVQEGLARFGHIDVLVNNAGYGYRAAVEEAETDDVAKLFATNFHGPVHLIQQVLPGMRARGTGTIVNISSIAAHLRPAGSGYYAASKAALEGVSGALQKEVGPLGLRVLTVEPGGFRTDFAGRSLMQSATALSDYAQTAGKRRKENDSTHGSQPGNPVKAAQALITAVEADVPPEFLLLGTDAYGAVTGKLDGQLHEIRQWKGLTTSTDYEH